MTHPSSNPILPSRDVTQEAASGAPSYPRLVAGPPSKHQLALMIWLAVFPTLTVRNLTLGGWLGTLTPVVRTFVLANIAVPIVIYGLCPSCTVSAATC